MCRYAPCGTEVVVADRDADLGLLRGACRWALAGHRQVGGDACRSHLTQWRLSATAEN